MIYASFMPVGTTPFLNEQFTITISIASREDYVGFFKDLQFIQKVHITLTVMLGRNILFHWILWQPLIHWSRSPILKLITAFLCLLSLSVTKLNLSHWSLFVIDTVSCY